MQVKNLESQLPKGAPRAMRKRGLRTDKVVMQVISEKPGITVQEISTDLGWTNGRVDGSINRLFKEGLVRVKHCIRKGTLIKKIFPTEIETEKPGIISIPIELIDIDLWKDEIHLYALSRSSIAISAAAMRDWEHKSFWKGKIPIKKGKTELVVRVPDEIIDFYQLENSDISLSTNDDFALVTVESTIIPVEVSETFPSLPVNERLVSSDNIIKSITEVFEPEYFGEYYKDKEQKTPLYKVPREVTIPLSSHKKRKIVLDTGNSALMPKELISQ